MRKNIKTVNKMKKKSIFGLKTAKKKRTGQKTLLHLHHIEFAKKIKFCSLWFREKIRRDVIKGAIKLRIVGVG